MFMCYVGWYFMESKLNVKCTEWDTFRDNSQRTNGVSVKRVRVLPLQALRHLILLWSMKCPDQSKLCSCEAAAWEWTAWNSRWRADSTSQLTSNHCMLVHRLNRLDLKDFHPSLFYLSTAAGSFSEFLWKRPKQMASYCSLKSYCFHCRWTRWQMLNWLLQ